MLKCMLCVLMICPIVLAQDARFLELDGKDFKNLTYSELDELLQWRARSVPIETRIFADEAIYWNEKFIDTPYEMPGSSWNLKSTNCIIQVARTIALSSAIDLETYYKLITVLAFKDGIVDAPHANHSTEKDWLVNNAWAFQDLTEPLSNGNTFTHSYSNAQRAQGLFKRGDGPEVASNIPLRSEIQLSYIPNESITNEILDQIQPGDFIQLVVNARNEKLMTIAHFWIIGTRIKHDAPAFEYYNAIPRLHLMKRALQINTFRPNINKELWVKGIRILRPYPDLALKARQQLSKVKTPVPQATMLDNLLNTKAVTGHWWFNLDKESMIQYYNTESNAFKPACVK